MPMLQGVQLIINRAGIHNNYVHGQGIIVEDRLNCSGTATWNVWL